VAVPGLIEILVPAVLTGGAVGWLVERRRRRRIAAHEAFLGYFDPTVRKVVEHAMALARSAPASDGKRLLRPAHLISALIDTEAFAVAIETLGGSPAAIKKRVDEEVAHPTLGPPTLQPLRMAMAYGQHQKRAVTVADLWVRIARTNAAPLVEVGPVDAHALSFVLVHGRREPVLAPRGDQQAVVIHNDHSTTFEFVIAMLREVFGLSADRATELAKTVDQTGKGVIARYPTAEAVAFVEQARALARRESFALWVDIEPA